MGPVELVAIAFGLAMDAFAVSVGKGLSVGRARPVHALTVGAWFGGFQALMPLLGFLLGYRFGPLITSYDHWVAFGLLALIGAKMIRESLDHEATVDASFAPRAMFPLAVATSIDALAVGVTFAFLEVAIVPAIAVVGVITFAMSVVGLTMGSRLGERYKSRAELVGGLILIGLGVRILIEHLGLVG